MNVGIDDAFGTLTIANNNKIKLRGYYSTLDAIRPLFRIPEWQSATTGWYVNAKDYNVRIPYFCSVDSDPRGLVDKFTGTYKAPLPRACILG